jgi:hypothetical protein
MSLRAIVRWGSMADTSADGEGGESIDPGDGANISEGQTAHSGAFDEQMRAQISSPLLVGCIAYAILTWMIVVVIVIYAWKLFGS